MLIVKPKKIIAYRGVLNGIKKQFKYFHYNTNYNLAKKSVGNLGTVEKAEITYKNPFIINNKYHSGGIILDGKMIGFFWKLREDVVKKLKDKGFDCIFYIKNSTRFEYVFEIMPFDESQIKIVNKKFAI